MLHVRVLLAALVFSFLASAAVAAAPGDKRTAPVGVGEIAPDFTLADEDGRKHTLNSQRGRPVVLVFYRGHW
jgi:cytochrome oxidase Cu insertion factor (SCO1/SenC/PrrC family)